MNPAALALALLLGHEARITPEQWKDVMAMAELSIVDAVELRRQYAAISAELTRRNAPPLCPACEAAARRVPVEKIVTPCDGDECPHGDWLHQYEAEIVKNEALRIQLADLREQWTTAVEERNALVASVAEATAHAEAAARERDDLHALCDRQAAILSRVAVALRGPEPPLTRWSHADLPERAATVVSELADLRARVEAMNLQGAHYINIVVRRNGEDHIYEGDWLRALLAEKEAK